MIGFHEESQSPREDTGRLHGSVPRLGLREQSMSSTSIQEHSSQEGRGTGLISQEQSSDGEAAVEVKGEERMLLEKDRKESSFEALQCYLRICGHEEQAKWKEELRTMMMVPLRTA